MGRPQHFGWFFARGFGPQGWGSPAWDWDYRWTEPRLYQHSIRELEQAGLDLVIIEDAVSLGSPETIDLRVRSAYGGPKHDPLLLTPYLFAATESIAIAPTVNAGITPPYLAARQFSTLQHLSGGRFGVNVVTDVKSARHVGLDEIAHDAAYDRAEEWLATIEALWRSWGEGSHVADATTGRFADGSLIDAVRHRGEYFDVTGPLNAVPNDEDPLIVSPGGSGRGLGFAGAHSDVQLALAPLDPDSVRAYRDRVRAAAAAAGRDPDHIKVLFVFKPEIVSSPEEADRVVAASAHPTDEQLAAIILGQSSDLETDLTRLDLDRPVDPGVFGQHVSQGSIRGLLGPYDSFADATLRQLATAKARKGRITDGSGFVGTAHEVADFIERLGDDGDNDGLIFSGDLHPVTIHRTLDELVPELRRRGVLRRGPACAGTPGGARAALREF